MKHKYWICQAIVAVVLFFPQTTWSKWAEPKDAEKVYDFYKVEVDVKKDGSYKQVISQQLEILTKDAAEEMSIVKLSYIPNASKLKIIEAMAVIDGTRYKVDTKYFMEKTIFSETPGFDEKIEISIPFPNIAPGTKIYLKHEEVFFNPVVPGHYDFYDDFGDEYHKNLKIFIRSKMPLVLDRNEKLKFFDIKNRKSKDFYSVKVQSKNPFYRKIINEVSSYRDLSLYPWILVTTSKTWKDFGQNIIPEYQKILEAPLPQDFDGMMRAAKKKSKGVEQLNFVTSKLADKLKYMGDWRTVKGSHIPRSMEQVLEDKFGDCKDLSAVLVKMLRGLGYSSHVAWVERGVKPTLNFSSLPYDGAFNHAVVYAKLGKQEFWLDPSNIQSFAQGVFEDIMARPALVLDPENPRLLNVSEGSAAGSIVKGKYQMNFKKDDKIQVQVKLNLSGRIASEFTGLDRILNKKEIRFQFLNAISDIQRVEEAKMDPIRLKRRIVKPIKLAGSYTQGHEPIRTNSGKVYLFEVPGDLANIIEMNPKSRKSPLWMRQPATLERIYQMNGIEVIGEDLSGCSIESPWFNARRKYQKNKKGMQMTEKVIIKKPYINVDDINDSRFFETREDLLNCFSRLGVTYKIK